MTKQIITVIPGDGIGPEITKATKHAIALKGPLTTPIGKGFTSLNVMLRKEFDLYANVRPAVTRKGINSRFSGINLITVRENTEGMYSQEKQTLSDDGERAESVSVITRQGATRVLRYAYDMAKRMGRKHVSVVHKANILKATSGLFLEVSRDVREDYPEIETSELIIDNMCMQLVIRPEQFDVIVTTNLFGDILSDLCAGLVGGLGMAPGANVGDEAAIFEAVHGSAPDIAGKGIANPFALILAAAMMLDQMDMADKAERIRKGINQVVAEGDRLTRDLGGSASTEEITDALIERL
jgi:isocitrate dehydrogenase (NAD+)